MSVRRVVAASLPNPDVDTDLGDVPFFSLIYTISDNTVLLKLLPLFDNFLDKP